MSPKLRDCSNLTIFLLLLTTKVWAAERQCTAHSTAGNIVHMKSNLQVYCIFRPRCTKLIYKDKVQITPSQKNSTMLLFDIKTLTRNTTFSCKCETTPDPCGIDIYPGYPPDIPQNLTCVQKGEFGNVTCMWKKGRGTRISTTAGLWFQGASSRTSERAVSSSRQASASFRVLDSQFSVWVNASNRLGWNISAIHNFSLDDIVMPLPLTIRHINCSSRYCDVHLEGARSVQLVEVQHRMDQGNWTTSSFNQGLVESRWRIQSLKPHTLYEFQARGRLGPARGLWSEWSRAAPCRTDKEAPAKKPDVWYTLSQFEHSAKKCLLLFWKKLNESDTMGTILGYNVTVLDAVREIRESYVLNSSSSGHVRLSCPRCHVSVTAYNSKGHSPPACLTIPLPAAFPPRRVSYRRLDNDSIAISWQRPVSARPEHHMLEWYPAGRKELLQWTRVSSVSSEAVIRDLKPNDCYEVAVNTIYANGMGRATISGVFTWQTVPKTGPSPRVNQTRKDDSIQVTWMEIPHRDRGGCLTNYTVYLENETGAVQTCARNVSQRRCIFSSLRPGIYKLWITAWTVAGEGPRGDVHPVHIDRPPETTDLVVVVFVGSVICLTGLMLLCICHLSSLRQRVSSCCHCILFDIIPDPANSKWAKECAAVEGEMSLKFYHSDSSVSEDDPDTVDVQEIPREGDPHLVVVPPYPLLCVRSYPQQPTALGHSPRAPSPGTSPLMPMTTTPYLKSLSHESQSSAGTQGSRGTDITVDYISPHFMSEEDEEEDDEAEDEGLLSFVPCHQSPFLEPVVSIGGTLTLDAVKIDCSDFFTF